MASIVRKQDRFGGVVGQRIGINPNIFFPQNEVAWNAALKSATNKTKNAMLMIIGIGSAQSFPERPCPSSTSGALHYIEYYRVGMRLIRMEYHRS
jgi:hypothetical protein